MPGPLALAGMAAAGGVAEGIISSAFNAFQAHKNREFQERMSNTSHQREVQDLKAAGLNPILSARLGGSSTPPGSSAQAGQFSGTQRALEGLRLQSDIALQKAQAADLTSAAQLKDTQKGDITFTQQERLLNLKALTQQAMASAGLTDAQKAQLKNQALLIDAQIKKLEVETASSAFDQNKKRLLSTGFEAANKAVEGVKKFGGLKGIIQENFRRFKKAVRPKSGGASGSY